MVYPIRDNYTKCSIKSLVSNGISFSTIKKCIDENEISLDTKDLILHFVVALNKIYDQPDDGLEKSPRYVVVHKIRYVNKSP